MATANQICRGPRRRDDGCAGGGHLANAGVGTLLLDVTRDAARAGLERARALRPDPSTRRRHPHSSAPAASTRTWPAIAQSDWIIEAVVERLDVKRALFERIEPHRRADAIVSSNTSGIPIAALAEGRSRRLPPAFPRHAFLQSAALPAAARDHPHSRYRTGGRRDASRTFADRRLGKGVVIAKDTPKFIANHSACTASCRCSARSKVASYTIEEIDAMTGPAIGRPKSATFRTMDIAGIDVLAHVARNLSERLENAEDRAALRCAGDCGRHAARGAGPARRPARASTRRRRGGEILTLDPATMEYRPKQPARLPSLDAARTIQDVRERVRKLLEGQGQGRQVPARDTLVPTLDYAERVAPQIAHSPADVDRAMRWGFGWELGPFELRGAAGHPQARSLLVGTAVQPAWCGRMPAQASWTWATACSASSSIRR